MFGKKYDYQVRNFKDGNNKDFYNIKPYELLERDKEKIKQNPIFYKRYLELNKE